MGEANPILEAEAQDRNFVTALSRGMKILEVLGQHPDGLSNTELSRLTELPKPTIARLTHTLIRLGYLRFNKAANTYQVTAKLIGLGAHAARTVDIAELTLPELIALRDGPNPGITVSLTEILGARVVFRNVVQSSQQNALWMQAGIIAEILETAAGRAMLLASDPLEQVQLLELIKANGNVDTEGQFRAAQEEYAAKGYCTGFRNWRADVNAIAAPFRAPGSLKVYAISVGGPSVYVSEDELEQTYGPLLKAAVKRFAGQIDV